MGQERQARPVPKRIEFGAMLEVPSLAEMLDMLLPRVDFLSIGTNDLTQFLFAADRADPRLAERYDWLSPAILRFLRRVMMPGQGGRRASPGLRRNGRPSAGSDGADRYRDRQFFDHPGSSRAGQGDGALDRCRGGQGRRSRRCSPSRRANMRKSLADWAQAARGCNRLIFHRKARLTAGHRLPTTDAISSAWRAGDCNGRDGS